MNENQEKPKLNRRWNAELETELGKINHEAAKLVNRDWLPMHYRNSGWDCGLWEIISSGERRNIIHPGQTVLDMGSGSGSSSIIWAYKGYNVIGIELHQKLVELSRDGVQKLPQASQLEMNIKIYQGSYYPKEYIELREKKESIAQVFEEQIKSENRIDIFHPISEHDVYQQNQLNLDKIDIFFAYLWPIQTPSVMEIFQKYSKKDAILCLAGQVEDRFLEKLNLSRFTNSCYIKKI